MSNFTKTFMILQNYRNRLNKPNKVLISHFNLQIKPLTYITPVQITNFHLKLLLAIGSKTKASRSSIHTQCDSFSLSRKPQKSQVKLKLVLTKRKKCTAENVFQLNSESFIIMDLHIKKAIFGNNEREIINIFLKFNYSPF